MMVNPNEIRIDPQLKDLMKPVAVKTDSSYYQWASEIVEVVRANSSFTTMRVAEKLKADLEGSFVAENFCCDCDYMRRCEQ